MNDRLVRYRRPGSRFFIDRDSHGPYSVWAAGASERGCAALCGDYPNLKAAKLAADQLAAAGGAP
jgi:hypothetical protein